MSDWPYAVTAIVVSHKRIWGITIRFPCPRQPFRVSVSPRHGGCSVRFSNKFDFRTTFGRPTETRVCTWASRPGRWRRRLWNRKYGSWNVVEKIVRKRNKNRCRDNERNKIYAVYKMIRTDQFLGFFLSLEPTGRETVSLSRLTCHARDPRLATRALWTRYGFRDHEQRNIGERKIMTNVPGGVFVRCRSHAGHTRIWFWPKFALESLFDRPWKLGNIRVSFVPLVLRKYVILSFCLR